MSPFGRFRPVSSPALLAWIERAFVESAPPAAQADVRAQALEELLAAEIELIVQDEFVSRSNGVEWYRISLPPGTVARGAFEFTKPSGVTVRMEWQALGCWIAQEPDKPAIMFEAIESAT